MDMLFKMRPRIGLSHVVKLVNHISLAFAIHLSRLISVDVIPDIAVHDEKALVSQLISDIQPLVPGVHLDIIVDHNYSE